MRGDIPHQDVIFLDEADPIYNATGVRVRDYPVTLNTVLHRLCALDA